MNAKQIGPGIVLADFAGLTAYAVYEYGYLGFFDALPGNLVGIQVFVDLCIALTLIAVWMWRDARERGISAAPYLVVMLFTGSIGALAYLIRRERSRATANASLLVAA